MRTDGSVEDLPIPTVVIMAEQPNIDQLAASIAGASHRLDIDGQRLALAVYQILATGQPVSADAAATAIGADAGGAELLLRAWPGIFWADDLVIGFWGLTLRQTPHRLRVAGVQMFTWCAWDPLFIARIVGESDVATDDPITRETITYRIGGDGAITGLSHPTSVLSFLRPDRAWDNDVISTFCHYVLHFTSTATAYRWMDDHPGTFTITLPDAVELARRHVKQAFGTGSCSPESTGRRAKIVESDC